MIITNDVIRLRRLFLLTLMSLHALPSSILADDICEATAVRNVPAIEDINSVLQKGQKDEAITEFRVDVKTGLTSYCSHGGYCYPTHILVGSDLLLALKMTNCKPSDSPEYFDKEEGLVVYGVDVIRSVIPQSTMRREDVKNQLLKLGLCEACSDNVAEFYVKKPDSQCGQLARSALEGNPDASRALLDNPSFCRWDYSKR